MQSYTRDTSSWEPTLQTDIDQPMIRLYNIFLPSLYALSLKLEGRLTIKREGWPPVRFFVHILCLHA